MVDSYVYIQQYELEFRLDKPCSLQLYQDLTN
jgi:hypothetical protein